MNNVHLFYPKFSVIVPVYNSENYLADCIRSLVNQTYTHLEIILIDDGSTDSSLQISRSLAENDARIKVLTKRNGGQSSARNLGLDLAEGEFIAFIDSDDEISIDVFENAVASFEKYPEADAVQFPVFMNFGTSTQYLNIKKEQLITGRTNLFREWIETGNVSWIVCNKIFRKKVFEKLRFQNMYYEDNYMVAEVLFEISALYIMNHGIYYYFRREHSTTTSTHSLQKELDTQKVNFRIYEYIKLLGLSAAMVLIQEKILNVSLSLIRNFNHEIMFFPTKDLKIRDILYSQMSSKQKIKLILYRFLGNKVLLKLYRKL